MLGCTAMPSALFNSKAQVPSGGRGQCAFRPPPGLPDPRVPILPIHDSCSKDGRLSPEALAALPSDMIRMPLWGAPPPLPGPRSPWQGMASVSTASSEHGWNPESSDLSDHADVGSASSLEVSGASQTFVSQQPVPQQGRAATSPPPGLSGHWHSQCSRRSTETHGSEGDQFDVGSAASLKAYDATQASSLQQSDLELDNEESDADGDVKVQQPTLHSHGPQRSKGSELHNVGQCTPCAFYCFKKQGCGKDADCAFCHMAHTSNKKLRQQEWRKKQQELQKRGRKQRGAKKAGDEPQTQVEEQATSVVEAPALVQQPSVVSVLPAAVAAAPKPHVEARPEVRSGEQEGAISSGAQSFRRFLSIHPNEPCFIAISPSGCRLYTYADQL